MPPVRADSCTRALGLSELRAARLSRRRRLFTAISRMFDGSKTSSQRPTASRPYPVDDAAVHHVFDGGWIWVLQFNNGITSAGIAATDAFAEKLQASPTEQRRGSGSSTEFRHSSPNSPRRKRSVPSRTSRVWPFAARRSPAADGPSCRRRQDSSIRCFRPAFRSRCSASPGWPRSSNATGIHRASHRASRPTPRRPKANCSPPHV